MPKIMLVEDDNNLSEIYQARMMAEGYTIISAHNGEEALALAVKEKPDLVISDVMMPNLSGFEMLDILRNTEGLKEVKVIMLTALGQAEDKARADKLGADRYLVKSQVTLEDIVNAAHELLGEATPATPGSQSASPTTNPAEPTLTQTPVTAAPTTMSNAAVPAPTSPVPEPAATPVSASPVPAPESQPARAPEPLAPNVSDSATPAAPTSPPEPVTSAVPQTPQPEPTPSAQAPQANSPQPEPTASPATNPEPSTPPTAATPAPAPEPVIETPVSPQAVPASQSTAEEEAEVQNQITNFEQQPEEKPSTTPEPPATNDQVMSEAIDGLMANNADGSHPEVVMPPAEASTPTPEIPVEQTPPTPVSAPAEPETSTNNSISINGKKTLQPITNPETRPDLKSLLAAEEAKTQSSNPTPDSIVAPGGSAGAALTPPHQPGNVFTPAATHPDGGPTGVDPNSISL